MYNILICDDEKDIVSALRIYLESEGYQVYTAYDGLEALEVLETKERDPSRTSGYNDARGRWDRSVDYDAKHVQYPGHFPDGKG